MKKAYGSEAAAWECEPGEACELHFFGTLLAHYVAAGESEAAAFHGNHLGHPARGLPAHNVWGTPRPRREGGPPGSYENLGMLRVEMSFEPRLRDVNINRIKIFS